MLQTIRERLLKAGAQAKIKKAIEISKRRDSTSQSKDERIMADRDDFQSISKLLGRWKDELAAIQDCIDHRNRSLEPIPEALSILSRYSEITETLRVTYLTTYRSLLALQNRSLSYVVFSMS